MHPANTDVLKIAARRLTFAMITPALISGSIIGRMRVRTWILFVFFWSTIVYNSIAHWVWSAWEDEQGGVHFGWLRSRGALDFAGLSQRLTVQRDLNHGMRAPNQPNTARVIQLGGTVVHISSGFAALAAALVIGEPSAKSENTPHNVPLVFIGTALLWFGW